MRTTAAGTPVVLIHGYPLERCVLGEADRGASGGGPPRHHLRPPGLRQVEPAVTGYNYDTFAADLHKIVTKLALKDFVLAGFSMGGGEVARYHREVWVEGRQQGGIHFSAFRPSS